MNLYRVGFRTDNGTVWEEVKAGDMQNDNGVLVFRPNKASNDVIMAYKTWDLAMRAAKDI